MAEAGNPNIDILIKTVNLLGPLADEMVFIGGCATGLLLSDPAAPPIRVTEDVDVIVEVTTLTGYHRLSEQLRKRGFREDLGTEAPICRWKASGSVLDVMPTNPKILGFGNQWFGPALQTAITMELFPKRSIRLVTGPYFLATKLEAFEGRGKGDYLLSHDMEDIIVIVDGRSELIDEIRGSRKNLKTYLSDKFAALLKDPKFIDALPGHLPPDMASQARLPLLMERIQEIVQATTKFPRTSGE
jgi:hypothetical protein